MRPSVALDQQREAIRQMTAQHRARNPRVFGSVANGSDHEGSDLDLLVDPLPGATLFDLGGLQVALEALLGVQVDVLTPGDLPPKFRDEVLVRALPV
jgi:predicted nucleotidyltransferase